MPYAESEKVIEHDLNNHQQGVKRTCKWHAVLSLKPPTRKN
jgi:hypothetical protein